MDVAAQPPGFGAPSAPPPLRLKETACRPIPATGVAALIALATFLFLLIDRFKGWGGATPPPTTA